MFSKKSDISNHQQFVCEAFLDNSDVPQGKWDARAEKAIFVGYPTNGHHCASYHVLAGVAPCAEKKF